MDRCQAVLTSDSSQSAFHSRLGWTDNAKFLEEFRYIVIASQLLNDIRNPSAPNRRAISLPAIDGDLQHVGEHGAPFNLSGLFLTAVLSFALAWSMKLLRTTGWGSSSWWRIGLSILVAPVALFVSYTYWRQQRLQNIRKQAVGSASSYAESAHSFDAAASAALALIQEVEVVSRGYKL